MGDVIQFPRTDTPQFPKPDTQYSELERTIRKETEEARLTSDTAEQDATKAEVEATEEYLKDKDGHVDRAKLNDQDVRDNYRWGLVSKLYNQVKKAYDSTTTSVLKLAQMAQTYFGFSPADLSEKVDQDGENFTHSTYAGIVSKGMKAVKEFFDGTIYKKIGSRHKKDVANAVGGDTGLLDEEKTSVDVYRSVAKGFYEGGTIPNVIALPDKYLTEDGIQKKKAERQYKEAM